MVRNLQNGLFILEDEANASGCLSEIIPIPSMSNTMRSDGSRIGYSPSEMVSSASTGIRDGTGRHAQQESNRVRFSNMSSSLMIATVITIEDNKVLPKTIC
jgi:hypothetical protein